MEQRYQWRKSVRSGSGNDCVEVRAFDEVGVGVRDTKNRSAGHITVGSSAWAAFAQRAKAGEYDLK